jgi:hypothetical protein
VTLLITALICATVVWLAHRGEKLVRDSWQRSVVPEPAEEFQSESMPAALIAIAQRESEPWARQNAIESMQGLYAELKSWDKVLHAYTAGS